MLLGHLTAALPFLLLTLRPLTDDDIAGLLDRALIEDRGLAGVVRAGSGGPAHLLRLAGGDARRALTYLEEAAAGRQRASTPR